MNDGQTRVLFGSTEMLGTGVNAQKRSVALHHLDSPWRPSDLEQREGRAIRKGNEIAKHFADNKVDVIIYAVEKSLDSYKFNLLHNKQLFITQLKTNNMGARTIDEGSLDEKSGMNFSEYVAILSGNTDLLEKARLEKKIAALESERKGFNRNKSFSAHKLDEIVRVVNGNNDLIARAKGDWERYTSRAVKDGDGIVQNPIQLDGVQGSNQKIAGTKLNEIAKEVNTNGKHIKIGTLYGFNLLVKTEASVKEDLDFRENRFFIVGEGDIKYSYNNGRIATEPVLAARSFIGALEKIPSLIYKYQAENDKISKDIPILQEIVNSVWRKENELKNLKTELDVLDRKIQLSLKPIDQSEDKPEEKKNNNHTHKVSAPQEKRELTEEDKAIRDIQNLMSGKLSVKDFSQMCKETPIDQSPQDEKTSSATERLKEYKDTMGDRLVIGSVPKHNQSKGVKL
jgi:hypothetical protein